jgi:hypothetical protein
MFMVQLLVKFWFFIQELWERKSLQILYECWRRGLSIPITMRSLKWIGQGVLKLERNMWNGRTDSQTLVYHNMSCLKDGHIKSLSLTVCILYGEISNFYTRVMGPYSSNCRQFFVCHTVNWEPLGFTVLYLITFLQ